MDEIQVLIDLANSWLALFIGAGRVRSSECSHFLQLHPILIPYKCSNTETGVLHDELSSVQLLIISRSKSKKECYFRITVPQFTRAPITLLLRR